jgi:hypothetical protein
MKKAIATLLLAAAWRHCRRCAESGHRAPQDSELGFPDRAGGDVPPTATIHFISGQVPAVVNKDAGDSIEAFGDTKMQSETVLKKIKEILRA